MGPVVPAGARQAAASRGFTLLEVLVVLAILALAAGMAAVAFDRDERGTLVRESRRFAGALEYAAARAQMRGETLGVSADGSSWRFWSRSADGRWGAISDDEPLRPRSLPEPVTVAALAYAGQALPDRAIVPLRASGRNEPYAFALGTPQLRTIVASDPLNRVTVSEPAAPQ